MQVVIDHRTTYCYERPAVGIVQLLRLTPADCDSQQVLRWRVDIDADGLLKPFSDLHGNLCHAFYATAPVDRLEVRVTGEVRTLDQAGIVSGADEPLPPALYRRATALTRPSPAIAHLAERVPAGDAVARAHGLMLAVAEEVAFDTGATEPATDAATAFALRRGVCQDMAQILIAAARHLGIPARYVSGHYAAPEHPEQEAAHAWAELWIEGLGWISLDPAHRVSTTDGHVRVAIGFDSLDAAPVRGSRRGGGAESLAVTVHGRESEPRGTMVQWQQQA